MGVLAVLFEMIPDNLVPQKTCSAVTITIGGCHNLTSPDKGGKKEREIMNWQNRLEKTVIALNLIALAIGFGTLGILILVRGDHRGESLISGTLGIVVGSIFLLFAFYFCKHTWGRRLGKVSLRQSVDYLLPHHHVNLLRLMLTEVADLFAKPYIASRRQ
jgi:hypothetical protein